MEPVLRVRNERGCFENQGGNWVSEPILGKTGTADEEVLDALERHGDSLRRDMGQLQSLIDEAVGNLLTHFSTIAGLAQAQSGGQERDVGAALAREVEAHCRRAVVDLQCHDLVSQLIANMRLRIDMLEKMAKFSASGAGRTRQARDVLDRMALVEKRNPIAQPAMKTGDIDLF